jgi:hypothetical protein
MLIKINKQPIHVVEPDEKERDFSWVYMCVSTIGFTLILSLMDYICYIFFGTHSNTNYALHNKIHNEVIIRR